MTVSVTSGLVYSLDTIVMCLRWNVWENLILYFVCVIMFFFHIVRVCSVGECAIKYRVPLLSTSAVTREENVDLKEF